MKEITQLLRDRAVKNGPEYLTEPAKTGEKLVTNKNGEPIKILMVGAHFCIRVVKESVALLRRGYLVDAFVGKLSYGVDFYDRVYYWNSMNQDSGPRQLFQMTKEIKDKYDIIHYHNEPDYPVGVMKDAGAKIVVVDCHDLDSVRQNIITQEEVDMFRRSDAAVFVSKPVADWAYKIHNYEKPTTIIYPFCNEGVIEYDSKLESQRHGIVYEGGANPPNVTDGESFRYRSLYPLCKQIVEMGNELSMYIGNADAILAYSDIGATIFPPTHYEEMMLGMTKFKWGLVAFNNEDKTQRQTNWTSTNKMFEYLAAGLPLIVFGAEESGRITQELGVGIVLEKLEDLGNVEENYGTLYPQLKANVERVRRELVMENHIWRVENLYRSVLYGGKQGEDNI